MCAVVPFCCQSILLQYGTSVPALRVAQPCLSIYDSVFNNTPMRQLSPLFLSDNCSAGWFRLVVIREQRVSPVFSLCNDFQGRTGSCCVVCCCLFLMSSHLLQYCSSVPALTGRTTLVVWWFCLPQWTNTLTLTFFALRQWRCHCLPNCFDFVNSQSGVFCGVETPTAFSSETYHSHLLEVLNAAVEWTEPRV